MNQEPRAKIGQLFSNKRKQNESKLNQNQSSVTGIAFFQLRQNKATSNHQPTENNTNPTF